MPAIWHCNHDRFDAVSPFYRAERAHRVRELNYYYDDCHCRHLTTTWCQCPRRGCYCSSTVALRPPTNCSRQLWMSHVMNWTVVSHWSSYWYTKCAQCAAMNAVPEIHRRAGVPNVKRGEKRLLKFVFWAEGIQNSPHCCCCYSASIAYYHRWSNPHCHSIRHRNHCSCCSHCCWCSHRYRPLPQPLHHRPSRSCRWHYCVVVAPSVASARSRCDASDAHSQSPPRRTCWSRCRGSCSDAVWACGPRHQRPPGDVRQVGHL